MQSRRYAENPRDIILGLKSAPEPKGFSWWLRMFSENILLILWSKGHPILMGRKWRINIVRAYWYQLVFSAHVIPWYRMGAEVWSWYTPVLPLNTVCCHFKVFWNSLLAVSFQNFSLNGSHKSNFSFRPNVRHFARDTTFDIRNQYEILKWVPKTLNWAENDPVIFFPRFDPIILKRWGRNPYFSTNLYPIEPGYIH